MHAYLNDRGMLRIVVSNYHDGEYPFDRMTNGKAHVYEYWNSTMEELAEYLHADDATMMQFLRSTLQDGLEPMEFSPGMTVYHVSGAPEQVLSALLIYVSILETDVMNHGPGADDGTYDYFPGAVEACAQMVEGFKEVGLTVLHANALNAYNNLILTARTTHYAGNEEAESLLPYINV